MNRYEYYRDHLSEEPFETIHADSMLQSDREFERRHGTNPYAGTKTICRMTRSGARAVDRQQLMRLPPGTRYIPSYDSDTSCTLLEVIYDGEDAPIDWFYSSWWEEEQEEVTARDGMYDEDAVYVLVEE